MATTLEPRYSVSMRRFKPVLNFEHQRELMALVGRFRGMDPDAQLEELGRAIGVASERRRVLAAEGIPSSAQLPTVAYGTALRLLRDLLTQGWVAGIDEEGIFLLPPEAALTTGDPAAAKQVLRRSFSFARKAQLADPATARFILDMERRGISSLFESGTDLAERLERSQESNDVGSAIRPVLEEVTAEATDRVSGLRLQDMWRYARHLWSIPYQSTPGRNMHYLVRDDATPNRVIIGIAALGNAVLGLSQRDEALGWSIKALRNRLRHAQPWERLEIAERVVGAVRAAISDIYSADLVESLDESSFNEDLVEHLSAIEQAASGRRSHALEVAGDNRNPEYHFIRHAHSAIEDGRLEDVDWIALAKTDLYTRKRAGSLSHLIRSLLVFRRLSITENSDALLEALDLEEGRRAVDVALRQIKVRAIAENVMEIITCGAVAPYGEVLGGKLVAMLLASPQVAIDFRERYLGRVSLIASAMKAAPVYRDPNLVLLTTSSLYSVGSSQYNRIKIPAGVGKGAPAVAYEFLGRTDSFGTVHIGPDTADGLRAVATLASQRRQVNHLFGEGISPKLRTLRAGLDALGLESDVFLRHHSPRLLYGVKLCRNTDDLLLGKTEPPQYILASDDGPAPDEQIAAVWKERWLRPRLSRAETVGRLRARGSSPLAISRELPERTAADDYLSPSSDQGPIRPQLRGSSDALTFVEKLYRSANSYADRLTAEELEWINVDLGLDDYLIDRAEAGKQIIVTGNPGDGKTHLIERLRQRLEDEYDAVVLTDANAISDAEILKKWKLCATKKRPFVLAINEWPLFVLRRLAREQRFAPVEEAVRQVQQAVRYFGSAPQPPNHDVVVVDLSLRNLLAPEVLRSAIKQLTHQRFYAGLREDDPALVNRDALSSERVQERLIAVLGHVAWRSGHVTMRQLMGFFAYLITGGQSAIERLSSQGSGQFHYANLAFVGGEGALFDALRNTFDPAVVTHPVHDLNLWRGTTDSAGWLDVLTPAIVPTQFPEEDRASAYAALKRKFFFEHASGGQLLQLIPTDEKRFEALLNRGGAGDQKIVRDLLLGINRFYDPNYADEERDELVLWQSHRFDVRPPDTFVALHRIGSRQFRIEPPKVAEWVQAWLPSTQTRRRTFALVASDERTSTAAGQLIVDRELFLTLTDAEHGLGRASWSGSATRKITRFVDRLHQLVDLRATVDDVRVRDTSTGLERKYEIQREPAKYRV